LHEFHETNGRTSLLIAARHCHGGVLGATQSPLTYAIVGALLDLHSDMGPGRLPKTVHRADFVCHGKVLLELKALAAVGPVDDAQVLHYLKASGLPVRLPANFGEASLALPRMVGPGYDQGAPA
jgi:hypothetical protein